MSFSTPFLDRLLLHFTVKRDLNARFDVAKAVTVTNEGDRILRSTLLFFGDLPHSDIGKPISKEKKKSI